MHRSTTALLAATATTSMMIAESLPPIRVIEQNLFPPKSKRGSLPFTIVKQKEKRGLKVKVQIHPPGPQPKCEFADASGNVVPPMGQEEVHQGCERESPDTYLFWFEFSVKVSDILRLKFTSYDEESTLSDRFAVLANTGKDRPEMKVLGQLLWHCFQDQFQQFDDADAWIGSATTYISDALFLWQKVKLVRCQAEVMHFLKWLSKDEGVLDNKMKMVIFQRLFDILRGKLPRMRALRSGMLWKLWHDTCPKIVLPLFMQNPDELLAQRGDFILYISDSRLMISWMDEHGSKNSCFECRMRGEREELWEIAYKPQSRLLQHTRVASLAALIQEFEPLERLIFLNGDGKRDSRSKDKLFDLLPRSVSLSMPSPEEYSEDQYYSITSHLENIIPKQNKRQKIAD